MPGGKHILATPIGRHVFGTVKVGEKGQIVIPRDARIQYGINPGDTLLILGDDANGIIVTSPNIINDVAEQVFNNIRKETEKK